MENERWISSKEAAEHIGVNKDTLQRWITNKIIPCHCIGRLWKFRISEIDSWIQEGKTAKKDLMEEK